MTPMIVGLPRSRTAWLSVFMSQSNTYFHHEAINGCYSLDEYNEKIKGCGDSTTGIDFIPSNNQRIVVIKKNSDELERCIKWCDSEYEIDSRPHVIDSSDKLSTIKGLVVEQSEINEKLQDIWEYLVDDDWHEKYKAITKMNIQVTDTKINVEAAKALYESIQ